MTFNTEHHPGVCAERAAATQGFVLNHTMLRVKDPAVALDFYTRVMGLRLYRLLANGMAVALATLTALNQPKIADQQAS